MTDIKIGDYVTVINADKQYTTYVDWAESQRLTNWKGGNSCNNGFSGFVTAISSHGTDRGKTLIAVCSDSHEIIINIKGVVKVEKTSGIKPIKKGMTEAVTRDGRKVTQLTWFYVEEGDSVVGVVNGEIETWQESGMWYKNTSEQSQLDIFAPVEYEWQWLVKDSTTGKFKTSNEHYSTKDECSENVSDDFEVISRIEESKREAK